MGEFLPIICTEMAVFYENVYPCGNGKKGEEGMNLGKDDAGGCVRRS